ncbi:MAG: hypothetical protein KC636_00035 [Myxococcales bacterium]|nr:hypothetical protein [Myxococcales bacterium]
MPTFRSDLQFIQTFTHAATSGPFLQALLQMKRAREAHERVFARTHGEPTQTPDELRAA